MILYKLINEIITLIIKYDIYNDYGLRMEFFHKKAHKYDMVQIYGLENQ